MILQYIYKPILNFIYEKITYRISDKVRNTLLFCIFFAIFVYQFYVQYYIDNPIHAREVRDVVMYICMFIIIVLSVNKRLEIIKWNKLVYCIYIGFGIFLAIGAFDHDLGPGFRNLPIEVLIVFMCFYFVWGNRKDYRTLFTILSWAYFVFATLLMIAFIIKYPLYDSGETAYQMDYAPMGINPNNVYKIFMPGIATGFYLMSRYKYSFKYVAGVIVGALALVVYVTNSRAGLMNLIVMIPLGIIYQFVYAIRKNKESQRNGKKYIVRFISILLCFAIGVGGTFLTFNITSERTMEDIAAAKIQYDQDVAEAEANGTYKISDWKKMKDQVDIEAINIVRSNDTLYKINLFTAQRLVIWITYLNNTKLFGSEVNPYGRIEYAHNFYIELAQKAGIFAGVFFLLLTIVIGVYMIGGIIRSRFKDKEKLFAFLVFTIFFFNSMLDIGMLPFDRSYMFIYYLIIGSIIVKKTDKVE